MLSSPEPQPESQNSGLKFVEMFAPRSALYEVLPDFLLRLGDPRPSRERPATPAKPDRCGKNCGKLSRGAPEPLNI